MLSESDLKAWLHKDVSRADKILLILSTKDNPSKLPEIRRIATNAGLRIPSTWNISSILARTKGLAINVPDGWEIAETGRQHLRNLGVSSLSPAAVQVASDLRAHLAKIANVETRNFVEEAIKCHEAQLYRSAVVMSWLAAVDVLHKFVAKNHLSAFNSEARRIDPKWKEAKNSDDLRRMGESDFLDRIAAISVLSKNTKEELQKALKLRNGCGHPNSLKVGPNAVAHHLEMLLQNVFDVFPA